MTMALHVLPIIMAASSSTRQKPFSRALYPKQLLALSGDQSLFQQATQRLMKHRHWGWYDSSATGRAFRSNASWSNPAPA